MKRKRHKLTTHKATPDAAPPAFNRPSIQPGQPSRTLASHEAGTREAAPDAGPPIHNWPVIQPIKDAYALALQFQFEESQWWPEARLLSHQLRRIQDLVDHAARTVPYYRGRLSAVAGRTPGTLTLEAFRELPLLRRVDIQEAGDALVSRATPKAHGKPFRGRSSGSTGRPIEFMCTNLTDLFITAFSLRHDLWHKRDFAAKRVSIITRKETANANLKWAPVVTTGPMVKLDIARPINELYDEVLREDPAYLVTHPNTLKGLIERSVEIGTAPASLREALTFGEPLEAALRSDARAHWNVPVTDSYSAMEAGAIAIQCPETTNLHVLSEGILVEVLGDAGQPCRPGEIGRIVLTPLHNFAMPLIRYEIGDYVRIADACPCGRGLPVLDQVVGRERTLLVYPSGERQFPEVRFGTLAPIAPIRQFQITQKTVERIEVTLAVPRPLTGGEESALRAALTERLRHAFNFEFVYVDEIPRAASGKFFEFQSEVAVPPGR